MLLPIGEVSQLDYTDLLRTGYLCKHHNLLHLVFVHSGVYSFIHDIPVIVFQSGGHCSDGAACVLCEEVCNALAVYGVTT